MSDIDDNPYDKPGRAHMTSLYLAGPMTNMPDHNFPLFDELTDLLRRAGYEVISPAEMDRQKFGPEAEGFVEHNTETGFASMTDDIHAVLVCDMIALLPEWEKSRGARVERTVAEICGKPIFLIKPGRDVGSAYPWVMVRDPEQRMTTHVTTTHDSEFDVEIAPTPAGGTRHFAGGATRDDDARKHDYEGFLSVLALRRYGEYMHAHRKQGDIIRDSDNWQTGFGQDVVMKSMWRHFMDVWALHRGVPTVDFDGQPVDIEDALCAVIFNANAMLHEILKDKA
jgi:nucleoside 2-deoxyribosyltransferase